MAVPCQEGDDAAAAAAAAAAADGHAVPPAASLNKKSPSFPPPPPPPPPSLLPLPPQKPKDALPPTTPIHKETEAGAVAMAVMAADSIPAVEVGDDANDGGGDDDEDDDDDENDGENISPSPAPATIPACVPAQCCEAANTTADTTTTANTLVGIETEKDTDMEEQVETQSRSARTSTSPTTATPSPRSRMGSKAKSAVSQLESETRSLLGRIGAKSLKTARRAVHLEPTLEQLRLVGFEEFVRKEVLGVPLELLDLQRRDVGFGGGGGGGGGGGNGADVCADTTNGSGRVGEAAGVVVSSTSRGRKLPLSRPRPTTIKTTRTTAKTNVTSETTAKTTPVAPPPPLTTPPTPTRTSSRTRERNKAAPSPRTPLPLAPPRPAECLASAHSSVGSSGDGRSRSATTTTPALTRTSSRIRERRKHGILSGESPEVLAGLGVSASASSSSSLLSAALCGCGSNGGSRKLPRSLAFGASSEGSTTAGDGPPPGTPAATSRAGKKRPSRVSPMPRPPPPPRPRLWPDPSKTADGLCKITLPEGWWDRRGICDDTTARGPAWAAGTRLGDLVITTPIKQCAGGIAGVFDFAMLEMPPMTVAQFRARADAYRADQLGKDGNGKKEGEEDTSDEAMDLLARRFWRRLGPTMEPAYYGADHEGTLFDGDRASGWNIDMLESCLSLLRVDASNGDSDEHVRLPGVTSAYLYFGMWSSTFAAHTEDMNLLSINYLHAGAPKYWYAISPDDSARFESLMVSHFPGAARDCPDFLRHKQYLLSPAQLTKAGIKYSTCVQRPGDAVITMPGSYHFGFNTGFNVAESTNFAVPEWVPLGDAASVCLCHPHSVRIDMRRFKELLRKYERDVDGMERDGLDVGTVTYSEWAKYEARRIKQAKLAADKAAVEEATADAEVDGGEGEMDQKRVGSKKGMVVEVLRLDVTKKSHHHSSYSSSYSPDGEEQQRPRKRSKKVSGGRGRLKEVWRLALRARPSVFLIPGTPVLCCVKAERDEDGSGGGVGGTTVAAAVASTAATLLSADDATSSIPMEERFFAGTVVRAAEGHVRIHFAGSARKEDVWLPADSPKLFLDGGPESPPGGVQNVRTGGTKTGRGKGGGKK